MTTMNTVETLRIADIDLVAKIHATCFYDAWGPPMIRQVLDMPGTFALIVRRKNYSSIIGFALARIVADECELLSLGVESEHRANGAGSLLLTAAMARATSERARWFFLEVAEDNDVALRLYRSHGLARVGYRLNYYDNADGTKTNALTMRCQLLREL